MQDSEKCYRILQSALPDPRLTRADKAEIFRKWQQHLKDEPQEREGVA